MSQSDADRQQPLSGAARLPAAAQRADPAAAEIVAAGPPREGPLRDSAPQDSAPRNSAPRGGSLDATDALALSGSQVDAQAARLVAVLDEYLVQLKHGQAPEHDALLAAHPDLAEQLAGCLAGLKFIHAANDSRSSPSQRSLGDFRIIREIGHGGMGAVYEAEQISLGRRVALKILRFGGVSDPEAIQRFQREAETVAQLHHTNIVPIFALGSEHGVNYYAMQFIDGQSLDQVLRQQTERGQSLSPQTVARWGLQAAEALAHAHARDVIHRDVKPSNLLIDNGEGRIWLTDFGLAKRLDDVTLSMTGALLGTPRYMSPEQAAAAHHKLDHRTDIYSLGASLYELVTGQPVFRGDSPHDVISQILTADPPSPRTHRPGLPRDLETILMKCLAKDAAGRYRSAQELVDDLRAFLDGRAIAARRAGVLERSTRWIKRQKRSVALSAAAAAATLLLVVVGVASAYAWQRSRLAYVTLKTDSPPLVAELLEGTRAVVPPATVPMQQRMEVPAGDYQLRLTSDGRLSQTYDVRLEPGEYFEQKLDLDDQLLWGEVQLDRTYQLVHFKQQSPITADGVDSDTALTALRQPGWNGPQLAPQAAVICLTADGLRCLWDDQGRVHWELNLREPTHPLLKESVQLLWPWDRFRTSLYARGLGSFDDRPMLVSQAELTTADSFDFNGDGTSDLVMAMSNQACLLAISGREGAPLWAVARGQAVPPTVPPSGRVRQGLASVLYSPQPVADQDGDAVADLLATFISVEHEQAPAERTVELISGANGRSLWRYVLPAEAFDLALGETMPYELRWFYGSGGGYSSSGSGYSLAGNYRLRNHSQLERSGAHHYMPTRPMILRAGAVQRDGRGAPWVTFLAGQRLIQLDLKTGDPRRAVTDDSQHDEFAVRPAIQPLSADLDADGQPDLLLVQSSAAKRLRNGQQVPQSRLVAWSVAKQEKLWSREVTASLPRQPEMSVPLPNWPLAVDLDGDGAAEVLTPDGASEGMGLQQSPPWGKLAVLDGRTGEPRWHRQLFTMDQRLEHFIAGPDVDRDGVGEVFVATMWSCDNARPVTSLFVDCLSGADGHTLWRAQQTLAADNTGIEFLLANLHWYSDGAGGWPQLIVPLRRSGGDVTDRNYWVCAGTGRVLHVATDVAEVQSGDFNADGTDDLLLFRRQNNSAWDEGGTLQVVCGVGDEPWRKIAPERLVFVGDLDADGVGDLLTQPTHRHFEAISGASGMRLWKTKLATQTPAQIGIRAAQQQDLANPLLSPTYDLNGDGSPDVLLFSQRGNTHEQRPLLWALSGRTGGLLWQSESVAQVVSQVCWSDCRDLDGDGQVEIVTIAAVDHGTPRRQRFTSDDARLWLIVVAGNTGKTRWAEPLTFAATASSQRNYRLEEASLEVAYADLDGDQVLDLVLPGQRSPGDLQLEMRGISGRDGRSLWRWPLPIDQDASESLANVPPAAAADIDGDGEWEVVVLTLAGLPTGAAHTATHVQLEVLEGATGKPRWQWQTPADLWANQSIHFRDRLDGRLRPTLVRRAAGGCWIAVRLWNRDLELHVLDAQGKVVSQLTRPGTVEDQWSRLWTLDHDGDGGEELLLLGRLELALLRPDQLAEPQWRVPQSGLSLPRIHAVLPSTSGAPTVVVQGGAGDRSLQGIDSANGQSLWTSVGPSPKRALPERLLTQLLNVPTAAVPPHVLHQFDSKALLRRGMPLAPRTEASQAAASSWQAFARRRTVRTPLSEDPRLLRPLPWKPGRGELDRLPSTLMWSGYYGLTLAVVPVAFVVLVLWRRQWSLRSLLGLMVVTAVVMLGVRTEGPDRALQTLSGKLLAAYLAAGPVIFTTMVLARWLWLGRWRSMLMWLAIALLTTAVMMALSLSATYWRPGGALQPGERYTWDGWYWIAPPVFYLATWALCLAVAGSWLGHRRWRRQLGTAAGRSPAAV